MHSLLTSDNKRSNVRHRSSFKSKLIFVRHVRDVSAHFQMDGMESDLTCCVCLEIFVYPLMLPCTHNLCRGCVRGLTRDGTVMKFNCPNCRKEVALDRIKGVDTLPRNLALDNLANLFRNKAKVSADRICIPHRKALDFYCQTCKTLVCEECVDITHTGFPHSVAAMKKLITEEKVRGGSQLFVGGVGSPTQIS